MLRPLGSAAPPLLRAAAHVCGGRRCGSERSWAVIPSVRMAAPQEGRRDVRFGSFLLVR